jgi:hypothetical protein
MWIRRSLWTVNVDPVLMIGSVFKRRRASALLLFCCDPAVRGLEPKGAMLHIPLGWKFMTIYMGILLYTVVESPFAPPTHDWFYQSRAGESLKLSDLQICVCWIRESWKFIRNYTSTLRLATFSTKEMICSHARWQDVVYVQHWGSSNAALPTLRIPLKHDKTKRWTMELEVYLPALSSLEK